MLYNGSMAVPVLATKLYIPPPPLKIVPRSRLLEQLNHGLSAGRTLSLISAPAGFGKTTLITEWITGRGQPAAWLSLDESDNDPVRFLVYIISALQTISPNLGTGPLDVLQSSQSSPIESVLTALLNEIALLPDDFILILDDYHTIDSRAVDNALTFFVEHMPSQVHVVITTREDPALPLSRYRARNQLTELRAADLRFTPAEAAEFLNQVMDLSLSAEEVTALETRTEGWIAGLQLAALSMKGSQDVDGFIKAFAGDHRYIVDYLVDEVLQRQPEPVRNFLLQTSILDRLNGPLCDAVTSRPGSKAKLESLQRGNLFLIPLDDRRDWYRYHHLFADVLHMHLLAELPDEVPVLHGRASAWYEQNGSAGDAIHHALAAQDFERAAGLIERAVPEMGRARQEATLLAWLRSLPDELLQSRPVLSAHFAGTLLQSGQLEGVEARLRDAERWLNVPAERHEQPIFVDEADFQRLPGLVAMYHAGIALVHGNVADTMKYARRVLEMARDDDDFQRGAASALLGLASWTSGDLETAYRTYAEGMAHLQKVGFISDAIGGSIALADIRITQGRLHEAMSIYQRGLQLAKDKGLPELRGTADMYVGMSELHREYHDLKSAMQHLLQSQELGEFAGFPQNPYRWHVAMARIRTDQADLDGALDLLDEAERLYVSDFYPNVRPIAAWRARVWVAQGKLEEARAWARQQGLSAGDELSYLREFEYITLARIFLSGPRNGHSDRSLPDAVGLLARLLTAAEQGGRTGSAIEILILQALAYRRQGDIPGSLAALERALQHAEPQGYVRMFLNEGEPMRSLLQDLRSTIESRSRGLADPLVAYMDKLLDAFARSSAVPQSAMPTIETQRSKMEILVEPLSQRELDILRLFNTELSGPEIAQELVIALSTVRTHTKSIYSKLNVNSRRAAVKRAMELGLI